MTTQSSLDEFARVSDLVTNLDKSHLFLSRVSAEVQVQIESIMGFQLGVLPI